MGHSVTCQNSIKSEIGSGLRYNMAPLINFYFSSSEVVGSESCAAAAL